MLRRLEGAFDRTSRFAPGCARCTVEEVSSDGYFYSPVSPRNVRAFFPQHRMPPLCERADASKLHGSM